MTNSDSLRPETCGNTLRNAFEAGPEMTIGKVSVLDTEVECVSSKTLVDWIKGFSSSVFSENA